MIRKIGTAVLMVGLFAAPLKGAPESFKRLEDAVSADTLAFVTIPDGARAKSELSKTALADIWREPEVQSFVQATVLPLVRTAMNQAQGGEQRRIRAMEQEVSAMKESGRPGRRAGRSFGCATGSRPGPRSRNWRSSGERPAWD